jgi:hypothetical protein
MTLNDMGSALKALGTRESGTKRFEDSVAAFREASTSNVKLPVRACPIRS